MPCPCHPSRISPLPLSRRRGLRIWVWWTADLKLPVAKAAQAAFQVLQPYSLVLGPQLIHHPRASLSLLPFGLCLRYCLAIASNDLSVITELFAECLLLCLGKFPDLLEFGLFELEVHALHLRGVLF